jgi:pantetheine-phosphate adenylyltransferase
MPVSHAVYPGTFDPFTAGHLDVVDRMRTLFDRVTVLVAVNGGKQPSASPDQRVAALRDRVRWGNVTVTAWAGLTVEFCRQHRAGVIVRGVRNHTDFQYETEMAAMNERLGVATLLVPARPGLVATSSTAVRAGRG